MCISHGLPPNYSELHPSVTKLSKKTTPNWSEMFRHTDAPSSCRQERRISKNEGSGHREHEHCGERIAPRALLTQQLTDNAPCCTNRLTQTAERVNAAINVQKMTQAEDGEFFALAGTNRPVGCSAHGDRVRAQLPTNPEITAVSVAARIFTGASASDRCRLSRTRRRARGSGPSNRPIPKR